MKQIELNGIWQAKIDPEDCGLAEGWAAAPLTDTMALQVPGCIQQLDCLAEAYPPQKDMRNDYLGTFFLEKKVVLPQLAERERCRLVLGGVLPCGDIWVNGRYVARHFYCVCAARVDITAYVQPGEENRITVAVTENHAGLSTGMRFAGRSWSGIYSRACIEIGAAVYMEDVYISNPEQDRAVIRGVLVNDGCQPFEGRVSAEIDGRQAEKAAAVPAYSRAELAWEIDVKGLERWAPRHPRLHELSLAIFQDDEELDRTVVSVGLRRLTAEGRNVCLDGRPVYLAGCGAEYYSPSISPLVDEKLIRRRFQAMLDHGFRFYRYHTHVPTEEEMAVADEMGMLLDVEFGLISNFNKTTPFEEGVEMLECYVRQTRRHPSVILYCLGNEGSQLMVDSQAECQRARIGYDAIKRNTTEQLALIAFGMQGELPELPNDLETPHLWSDNFLWGYDGLTDIPWETVEETTRRNVQAAFGKEELIDGIPYSDWNDYIGKAAPVYLNDYSRMQLQHTKISMCFSALVFGPFYFFYRKAWKPAFGFLAAELVVALPTLLSMMQATGSPLTAGISSTAIVVLSRIMTVFSFALVMLRTLYAKWLYRKSAAERIRRIRAEFPDAAQRRAVLSAQGGVSIAGVIGAFVLLMVLGACATVLMGPNLDALAGML